MRIVSTNSNPEALIIAAYRRHRSTPSITASLLAETAMRGEGIDPATNRSRFEELRSVASRLLKRWFEDGEDAPNAA